MSPQHRRSSKMKDEDKTRDVLIGELVELRESVAKLHADQLKRTQVEETLRSTEQVLQTILSAAPMGISYAEQGKLRWTNQAMAQMFGYERKEDYLGTEISSFYATKEEYKRVQRHVYRSLEKGIKPETEAQFRRKDGTIFCGQINVSVLDSSSQTNNAITIIYDIAEDKHAAEALRVQTERFQMLSDYAPFGMMMIGKDGTFTYVNPKFTEIFGYELGDVPNGSEWCRRAFPDPGYRHEEISVWMKDFAGLPQEGTESRVFTVTCKDGSQKIIDFRSVKLAGEALMTCEDITDRKRAEDALRESEEKYRTIIENIEDGYYEVDVKGKFTTINPSTARMFGRREDQMVGHHFSQFTTPEEAGRLFEAYRKVWTTGEPLRFDAQFLAADGTERLLELSGSLVKDAAGHRRGVRGVARDVSQRLRAEQALRQSEETARALLNATTDAALLMRSDGTVLAVNQRMALRLGLELQELVGRNLFELFPTGLARKRKVYCDQVISSGSPVRFVDEEAGAYLDHSVHPVFGNSDKVERLAVFSRDITDQKRAIEALRESEKRYRQLVENANDFISSIDGEGRFTLVNPVGARITGYSAEELLGKHYLELVHPDHRERVSQFYGDQLTKSLSDKYFECPIVTRSGEALWLRQNVQVVRDGDRVVGFQSIARDITARKNAEDRLRESEEGARHLYEESKQREELYRSMLNSSVDAIVIYNLAGEVQFQSPSFTRMFGWEPAEVAGQRIPFVPDSEWEASYRAIQGVLSEGVPVSAFETKRYTKDGRLLDVSVSASRYHDHEDKVAGILVILTDISDRKRAEQLRRENEERYRKLYQESKEREQLYSSVINSSGDSIIIYDVNGFVRHVNPSFTTMFGWPLEELVGKRIDFVPEAEREATAQATSRVLQEGGISGFETKRYTRDGRILDASLSASVYRDHEGKPAGIVVIHRDTTESKRAERAVEEALAEARIHRAAAEAANRAKSDFLAKMSHELRTPLNAIIGYSELLMEEAEDLGEDRFVPDLKKIRSSGMILLDLINDVLDLSKIEAGKMELFLEAFDVPTLVGELADTIRPLADKNGNILEFECPADLGTIYADRTKVRQSLANLLSNACKYTEHGRIELSASLETVKGVGCFKFVIRDSGIGMTPEHISKLFQDFSQADSSTTRKYGGTGLGLVITKQFCHMMGGDIAIESQYGEGTTSTIWIPAKVYDSKAGSVSAFEPAWVESAQKSVSTVLVIDDDAAIRELLERFLAKEGFRVETASDGKEGLQLARSIHPDAITLDVLMPGMDGWAVLTALKDDPDLAGIPVIMLTIVDDKNRGYTLGAVDYMTKPVDRDRLIATLHRYDRYGTNGPLSKVLLVEDDAATREMLRRILEKEGWHVEEAENGRKAMERMAEVRPDLILLDLMMSEMDGFEFSEKVRRDAVWRAIPIVVLTAKDLTATDRLRLNGYVDSILLKAAYTREALLTEVRNLLKMTINVKHQERNATS